MILRFEPIRERCSEIIDKLMSSPDMPADEMLLLKIRLCVEEVVTNIVNYAYERGDGWLEARTSNEGGVLTVTLRDAGTPFDPLAKDDPDVTLSAEDRKIGGLGIFICKKMMDSVTYRYEDGCNILTMTKKTE